MWFVYILYSLKDGRTYTGSTDDLARRIDQHSRGNVFSTRNRLPVRLVHQEDCADEIAARKLEQYYKSAAGRRKLKKILGNLGEKYSGVV